MVSHGFERFLTFVHIGRGIVFGYLWQTNFHLVGHALTD